MGMSGSTYMARQNEITKDYYNHLLATGKRDAVYTRQQRDGSWAYFMYH